MDMSLTTRVREWLTTVELPDDGRLPPERRLTDVFATTRNELRKALAVLESEGRLTRHVGRGTYLVGHKGLTPEFVSAIADTTSPLEAMQARLLIEPEIARLAALNATSAQMTELRRLTDAMRSAASWREYEDLDWQFHNLLAAASGNKLLIEVQTLVNGVRRQVVWGRLHKTGPRPAVDYHSFAEHEALLEAIADRDQARAAEAMRRHLESTTAALSGSRRDG